MMKNSKQLRKKLVLSKKKKPDWVLGAKEGEKPAEVEAAA